MTTITTVDSSYMLQNTPIGHMLYTPPRGYLSPIMYPHARPEHSPKRRHYSHATAHLRTLPIGNTKIALSVGSQSPLPAVVSVLLVLNVHEKRAFSSYSAYKFCCLQHSCYVNLGIRILTSFHSIYPDSSMGISIFIISL